MEDNIWPTLANFLACNWSLNSILDCDWSAVVGSGAILQIDNHTAEYRTGAGLNSAHGGVADESRNNILLTIVALTSIGNFH